jgi:predicted nucleic acid-binding protein
MKVQSCLNDPAAVLVIDASVVINLNATGYAREILIALQRRVAIVNMAWEEVEAGERQGWQNVDLLRGLVDAGAVELVDLNEGAERHFEQLVVGPARMTLDDGEAATIAYSVEHDAVAIIDERKARRVCGERFPALRVSCTVDMFAHPDVTHALGHKNLSEAVLNALQRARMGVLPHHLPWVTNLIGIEEAARCSSLPRSVRQAANMLTKETA